MIKIGVYKTIYHCSFPAFRINLRRLLRPFNSIAVLDLWRLNLSWWVSKPYAWRLAMQNLIKYDNSCNASKTCYVVMLLLRAVSGRNLNAKQNNAMRRTYSKFNHETPRQSYRNQAIDFRRTSIDWFLHKWCRSHDFTVGFEHTQDNLYTGSVGRSFFRVVLKNFK